MRIFFVHSGNETFVQIDRHLLGASFDVQDFHAERRFPAQFLQFWDGIRKNDLLFCWFASWNSLWALLFAKLLRKRSILIIGGYDVANLPEAGYGNQRGGLGKWVTRLAIRTATVLVTNSYYSQREAEINLGIPASKLQVIYHGLPDPWGVLPAEPRDRLVLTVGNVEWANLKRKGLEPFVRAATHLPEVQFVLVGDWKDDSITYLRSLASPNVCFTGRISDEELQAYYRRASVYVQASLHEGFGLSVAEAMLAGCVPVITSNGSLPEVVGKSGIYCSPNGQYIADKVQLALESELAMREDCRNRILSLFPVKKRAHLLTQLVKSALLN